MILTLLYISLGLMLIVAIAVAGILVVSLRQLRTRRKPRTLPRVEVDDLFALNAHQQEIIPLPLGVVDATIYEFMEMFNTLHQPIIDYNPFPDEYAALSSRTHLTTGSVEYAFRLIYRPIGTIRIQMLSVDSTLMRFISIPIEKPDIDAMGKNLLRGIVDGTKKRADYNTRILSAKDSNEQIPEDTTLRDFAQEITQRQGPGRPSKEEDDWAWNEVNVKGRPRSEVRKEWKQRLHEGRNLADVEASFRAAVSLKRDPERKKAK